MTETHLRNRKGGSAMLAQSEPMVWLTGGALAICLTMVLALLVIVAWNGLGTFWPSPLVKIKTVDGAAYLGEPWSEDSFELTRSAAGSLPEKARALTLAAFPEGDDPDATITAERRQLRTGNYELTNEHFNWVNQFEQQGEDELPEWALLLERREGGRFYGELDSFLRVEPWKDVLAQHGLASEGRAAAELAAVKALLEAEPGCQVLVLRTKGYAHALIPLAERNQASDAIAYRVVERIQPVAAAWAAFEGAFPEANRTHHKLQALEKGAYGQLNRRENDARLKATAAARRHGDDSPEHATALEAFAETKIANEKLRVALDERKHALRAIVGQSGLLLRTADGHLKLIEIGEIVRAVPANRLTTSQKLGVYIDRWGEFLADDPREANSEGGVMPAIFGTVVMTLLMSMAVVPFGVLAALYLREYAKAGLVVSAVRIAVNNLAGVPSIVFGVFGLGFFCYGFGKYIDGGPARGLGVEPWPLQTWIVTLIGLIALVVIAIGSGVYALRHHRAHTPRTRWLLARLISLLWIGAAVLLAYVAIKTPLFEGLFRDRVEQGEPTYGTGGMLWASLTLALLTLPVVIVATEEALAAVPNSMREGSYACGASKWQTIRRIVLPRAMPGIMTGMILAMARGAGEVAPLMIVGAVKLAPELVVDGTFPFIHPERSFMHLGFHIYDVGFQSQNSEAAKPMVFTTTLLLMSIIAALNLAAIWLRARLRRRFQGSQF